MKRYLASALISFLFISGAVTAPHRATPAHAAKSLSVLYYVNGSLGDKGFFDSGEAGVTLAASKYHLTVKTIQQADGSRWQSDLSQIASSHRYDIIIAGTTSLADQVKQVAKQYPKQTFVYYDDSQPGNNIVSVIYLQNEGSYLAGALAALVVDSRMPHLTGHKTIGMVGGQDIPVINDFKVGYTQGAHDVDPSVKVLVSYIGGSGGSDTWNNPLKGASLSKALYDQGADVVFNVAGGSGLGVLKQSNDSNRYSIGVDSNQNALYPGHVLSSMVKRIDNSFVDLLGLAVAGKLKTGCTYVYGLKNAGVGLVQDSFYRKVVPSSIQGQLNAVLLRVEAGKVKIQSAFKGSSVKACG